LCSIKIATRGNSHQNLCVNTLSTASDPSPVIGFLNLPLNLGISLCPEAVLYSLCILPTYYILPTTNDKPTHFIAIYSLLLSIVNLVTHRPLAHLRLATTATIGRNYCLTLESIHRKRRHNPTAISTPLFSHPTPTTAHCNRVVTAPTVVHNIGSSIR
jgi:hypothetical protein